MRQKPSIVLIVIAALLVVRAKVVAPEPGSPKSYFTSVNTAVPSGMKSFPSELSDVRFLAQSGHSISGREFPLSGVKQT